MTALFIVGAPGAGKTTLVRKLLDYLDPSSTRVLVPSPKWTVAANVCAAGHYNGSTFDGADTVPYNGVDAALAYWESTLTDRVAIFDGDRFSHASALERIAKTGARVVVAFVLATEEQLAERRLARGSTQNPAWMKGRLTKAKRFYEAAKGHQHVAASYAFEPEPLAFELFKREL